MCEANSFKTVTCTHNFVSLKENQDVFIALQILNVKIRYTGYTFAEKLQSGKSTPLYSICLS